MKTTFRTKVFKMAYELMRATGKNFSVSFDYETIGIVNSSSITGEDKNTPYIGTEDKPRGIFDSKYGTKYANIADALEALYQECLEYGADGVLNLKIDQSIDSKGNILSVNASGMAIKKK